MHSNSISKSYQRYLGRTPSQLVEISPKLILKTDRENYSYSTNVRSQYLMAELDLWKKVSDPIDWKFKRVIQRGHH